MNIISFAVSLGSEVFNLPVFTLATVDSSMTAE